MNCQFSDNKDYQPFNGLWNTSYTNLKVASVKPLLKKQSLSSGEFKNFRPISK